MANEDGLAGFDMKLLQALRQAANRGLGPSDQPARNPVVRPPVYDFSQNLEMARLRDEHTQGDLTDQGNYPPTLSYFGETTPPFTPQQREQLKAMGRLLMEALQGIIHRYHLPMTPGWSDGLSLASIVCGHNSYAEQLRYLCRAGITQGEQTNRGDVTNVFRLPTARLRDARRPGLFRVDVGAPWKIHALNYVLALKTGFLEEREVPSPKHPRMQYPETLSPQSIIRLNHPNPDFPFQVEYTLQTSEPRLPQPLTRTFGVRFRG